MKKTRIKLALMMACTSVCVHAQLNMQDYYNNPEWHECHSEMRSARIMAFPERHPVVRYIPDVVYMDSMGEDLTLQILKPEGGGGE